MFIEQCSNGIYESVFAYSIHCMMLNLLRLISARVLAGGARHGGSPLPTLVAPAVRVCECVFVGERDRECVCVCQCVCVCVCACVCFGERCGCVERAACFTFIQFIYIQNAILGHVRSMGFAGAARRGGSLPPNIPPNIAAPAVFEWFE